MAMCRQALAFAPDYRFCQAGIADAQLFSGDLAKAEANFLRAAASSQPLSAELIQRVFAALRGEIDTKAVAAELAGYPAQSALDPASPNSFFEWEIAPLLVMLGQPRTALGYLDHARRQGNGELVAWAMVLPALDPIRCEPRFQALVRAMNATDPHFERVCKENTP
jgi:hypothetical protein